MNESQTALKALRFFFVEEAVFQLQFKKDKNRNRGQVQVRIERRHVGQLFEHR